MPGTLEPSGWRVVRCTREGCGKTALTDSPLESVKLLCKLSTPEERAEWIGADAIPASGVGTELTKLIAQFNVKPDKSCNCAAKAAEWNRNGVEWCKANREEILTHLRKAYSGLSLLSRAAIAAKLPVEVAVGMAWEGAPSWLLNEALRRAEAQAQAEPKSQDGRNGPLGQS